MKILKTKLQTDIKDLRKDLNGVNVVIRIHWKKPILKINT